MQHFKAQRGRPRGDLPAIVAALGLEQRVLNQPWVELSVSAAWRISSSFVIAQIHPLCPEGVAWSLLLVHCLTMGMLAVLLQ